MFVCSLASLSLLDALACVHGCMFVNLAVCVHVGLFVPLFVYVYLLACVCVCVLIAVLAGWSVVCLCG